MVLLLYTTKSWFQNPTTIVPQQRRAGYYRLVFHQPVLSGKNDVRTHTVGCSPTGPFATQVDFLISYIKMHWLVISDNLCKIELFITTLNLKMIGYVQSSNIFEKYAWAPKQKDPRGLRPTVPNHITPQHEHHMGQHCSQFTRKSKMPQKVTVVYLFEIRWIKTLSTSKTMSGLGLYIWISDYWRCCECHSEQEFHIRWQWIIFE